MQAKNRRPLLSAFPAWPVRRPVRIVFCALNLFFAITAARPQTAPCFTANVTRGCVPLTINIAECTNGGVNLTYNYNDGSGRVAVSSHTYTRPGKYAVTQYGTFNATGDSLRRENYIEVLPVPEPAYSISRCANREISLQITDTVYNSFVIDWGDGPVEAVPAAGTYRHTYGNVNPRTVTVTGRHTGPDCGGSRAEAVTPLASLPVPVLVSIATENENAAQLRFQAEAAMVYRIEQRNEGTGTYTPVATLTSPSTGLVGQSVSGPQPATYRVVATDVCGNETPSDEIGSVLLSASAADGAISLAWQTTPVVTFLKSSLSRNDQLLQENTLPAVTTYTDNALQCGETYCYRLEIALSGGAIAISDTACAKAVSSAAPQPVPGFQATVTGNFVTLRWEAPGGTAPAREFVISRDDNNGTFNDITRLPGTVTRYEDRDSRLDLDTRCYRIRYVDNCGNISNSGPQACPLRLVGAEVRNPGEPQSDGYQLAWAGYEWPGERPTYEIERLNAQGDVLETLTSEVGEAFFPFDTLNQLVRFRVRAVAPGLSSESNILEFRQDMRLFVPQAFSPNGDGVNDVLAVKGLFIGKYRMVVYNRWGEAVFSSDNRNVGWTGTEKGSRYIVPGSTYAYVIRVEDQLGRETVQRGSVQVLR